MAKSKKKEIDYGKILIIISLLIFAILGCNSLATHYEPNKLHYPNHSGIHPIYVNGERIGSIDINAIIVSEIDVIAAGTPTTIIANISYNPGIIVDNETLHFWLWYMGVDNTWIIPVEEIYIKPGGYALIEKEISFLSEGVYRHALRSYNADKISPQYLYGSNFSVYGKNTAIAVEHSYIQRESNEKLIGLSYIVIAAALANIAIFLRKKNSEN